MDQSTRRLPRPSGIPRPGSRLPMPKSALSASTSSSLAVGVLATSSTSGNKSPIATQSRSTQASGNKTFSARPTSTRQPLDSSSQVFKKPTKPTSTTLRPLTSRSKAPAVQPPPPQTSSTDHDSLGNLEGFRSASRASSRASSRAGFFNGEQDGLGNETMLGDEAPKTPSSRLSLAERTVESISRLPPSGSRRRRSSFFGDASPSRPESRSNGNSSTESLSRVPGLNAGRLSVGGKSLTNVRSGSGSNRLGSSTLGTPSSNMRRSVSAAVRTPTSSNMAAPAQNRTSALRASLNKPPPGSRATPAKTTAPLASKPSSSRARVSSSAATSASGRHTIAAKPSNQRPALSNLSRGPNSKPATTSVSAGASNLTPKPKRAISGFKSSVGAKSLGATAGIGASEGKTPPNPAKSSAALREQIKQARLAKQKVAQQTEYPEEETFVSFEDAAVPLDAAEMQLQEDTQEEQQEEEPNDETDAIEAPVDPEPEPKPEPQIIEEPTPVTKKKKSRKARTSNPEEFAAFEFGIPALATPSNTTFNSSYDYKASYNDAPSFNDTNDDPFNQKPKGQVSVLRKRVDNARSTGRLDISGLGLTTIPEDVLKMYDYEFNRKQNSNVTWSEAVDLTKFIAADNELEKVDDEVFPDVDGRSFEYEGPDLVFMGIEVLDLRGNGLKEVPKGLRRLEVLVKLDLARNKLDNSAFEIISQVASLKELKISENYLSGALPEEFSRLESLEVLEIQDNKITELPNSVVSCLPNLRVLNIANNKLKSLPMSALASTNITQLIAHRNSLSGVIFHDAPPSLGLTFPKLSHLDVSINSDIVEFSPLDASSWSPTPIPIMMPAIKELILSFTRLKSVSIPSFANYTNLVTFLAEDCKLEALPTGFTSLMKLRVVDLQGNEIRTLDPKIGKMEGLESLKLGANPMRDRKFLTMGVQDVKRELRGRLGVDESGDEVD